MSKDYEGVPPFHLPSGYALEEDIPFSARADEDKGEWEVVPFGHPASTARSYGSSGASLEGKRKNTSVSQQSRAQNLEMEERLVNFQKQKMVEMTADLEVRERKMGRVECEMLARVEQQNQTSLELVKVKTDVMNEQHKQNLELVKEKTNEMEVNIPYLRSW
jgi:hypothetical protein